MIKVFTFISRKIRFCYEGNSASLMQAVNKVSRLGLGSQLFEEEPK